MAEHCDHEWAHTLSPNGRTGQWGQPLGQWFEQCVKCNVVKGDVDNEDVHG